MRNLIVAGEFSMGDDAPREDAICLTSNPFAKEIFVLYEDGLVVGLSREVLFCWNSQIEGVFCMRLNGTAS